MIRMVGAALLTGGSAAIGFGAVRHLEGRVCDLRELITGFEVMRRELDWRMAPLPELLSLAGEESRGRPSVFFSLCARGSGQLNGRSFQQVWLQGMEAAQMRLEEADYVVVERLGGVLGRYDGDNQRQALDQVLARLEEQRKQAVDQRARLGKVYGTLGVTAGVFLMILLI